MANKLNIIIYALILVLAIGIVAYFSYDPTIGTTEIVDTESTSFIKHDIADYASRAEWNTARLESLKARIHKNINLTDDRKEELEEELIGKHIVFLNDTLNKSLKTKSFTQLRTFITVLEEDLSKYESDYTENLSTAKQNIFLFKKLEKDYYNALFVLKNREYDEKRFNQLAITLAEDVTNDVFDGNENLLQIPSKISDKVMVCMDYHDEYVVKDDPSLSFLIHGYDCKEKFSDSKFYTYSCLYYQTKRFIEDGVYHEDLNTYEKMIDTVNFFKSQKCFKGHKEFQSDFESTLNLIDRMENDTTYQIKFRF